MPDIKPEPSPPQSGEQPPREYVTRFVQTTKGSAILPFVQAAINTAGHGSAVLVGGLGIQLTLPLQMLHFVEAAIKAYDKESTVPEFQNFCFYPPLIKVRGVEGSLKPTVEALGLCPPDMRIDWIDLGEQGGALAVSGTKDRQGFFTTDVLPSLRSLVHQVNPNPALGAP